MATLSKIPRLIAELIQVELALYMESKAATTRHVPIMEVNFQK